VIGSFGSFTDAASAGACTAARSPAAIQTVIVRRNMAHLPDSVLRTGAFLNVGAASKRVKPRAIVGRPPDDSRYVAPRLRRSAGFSHRVYPRAEGPEGPEEGTR
jgi:hypothetical protein